MQEGAVDVLLASFTPKNHHVPLVARFRDSKVDKSIHSKENDGRGLTLLEIRNLRFFDYGAEDSNTNPWILPLLLATRTVDAPPLSINSRSLQFPLA